MLMNFRNDDRGYRAWLAEHPDGFVVNTRARPDPDYMVLHSARCRSVSSDSVAPGGYTGHAYRKICAETVQELEAWVRHNGRPDGSFSKVCGRCMR